jgi:hypothetical protein
VCVCVCEQGDCYGLLVRQLTAKYCTADVKHCFVCCDVGALEQNLLDLDFGWSLAGIYVVTDGQTDELEGKEVIDPIAAVFVPHTTQSRSHPHSNRFTLAATSKVCTENMARSVTLSLPSFRTAENYWT